MNFSLERRAERCRAFAEQERQKQDIANVLIPNLNDLEISNTIKDLNRPTIFEQVQRDQEKRMKSRNNSLGTISLFPDVEQEPDDLFSSLVNMSAEERAKNLALQQLLCGQKIGDN